MCLGLIALVMVGNAKEVVALCLYCIDLRCISSILASYLAFGRLDFMPISHIL